MQEDFDEAVDSEWSPVAPPPDDIPNIDEWEVVKESRMDIVHNPHNKSGDEGDGKHSEQGGRLYPNFEGLLPSDISIISKVISQLMGFMTIVIYTIHSDIGVMS